MNDITIPNFGELLAEHLGGLPAEALPALLANLERAAAGRYRLWAKELPDFANEILASADREDDIANRVDKLFPINDDQRKVVNEIVPKATETYMNVFKGLTAIQQITIQANAERQGAAAWRGLVSGYPQFSSELEQLAITEETNADQLDSLLVKTTPGVTPQRPTPQGHLNAVKDLALNPTTSDPSASVPSASFLRQASFGRLRTCTTGRLTGCFAP